MATRYVNAYSPLFDQKRSLTCGSELPLVNDSRRFWARVRAFEELAGCNFAHPCYYRSFEPPRLQRYEFLGALFVGDWRARRRDFDYCWIPLFYGKEGNQIEYWSVLHVSAMLKYKIKEWQAGHNLGMFTISEYEKSVFGRTGRLNRLTGMIGDNIVSFMSPSVDKVVVNAVHGYTTPIWQSSCFADHFYRYVDGRLDRSHYFVPSIKYEGLTYNV